MARCAAPFTAPFYEPVPDYMRNLLLMGARFVAGNTGEGAAGSKDTEGEKSADQEEPASDKTTTEEPDDKEAEGEPSGDAEEDSEDEAEDEESDDFKSEKSKEAVLADLNKERTKRKKLQADFDSKVKELNETVSEKETAITERDQQLAQKDTEIHVLKLAIAHGINSQDDLDLLLDVQDQDKRDKLAERLGKAANQHFVISDSGTGGGDVGGTIAAGRDLYNQRRKNNV